MKKKVSAHPEYQRTVSRSGASMNGVKNVSDDEKIDL